MNNLKKVLALVIVLSMVISMFTVMTASAADFEDVVGTKYEEAVMTLAPMGVIAGYDENGTVTFKPDQIVTRAEMAAFIIRELGLNVASKSNTIFSDVPADFWGSGAISIANSKNIIVGYGDGKFGPDDQVSFQDAVKMIVCALGYEEDAKDNGGYPAGYMAQADKLDLLDDLSDKLADTTAGCDRGTVALLMNNALDQYLQEVTYYNGQVLTKTITSKTMASEMGYTKFEDVIVNATDTSAVSGSLQDKGYVALNGVKEDVKNGGFDMNAYLGQPVTVYASYDKKNAEYTIVAVVGASAKSDIKKLDISDVYGMDKTELRYYIDKDSSSKTSGYDLADLQINGGNLIMVYNNQAIAAADQDYSLITGSTNGTLTLIDSTKDGIYERVIIDTYRNYQVTDVDLDNNELTLKNANNERPNVELDDSRESNRPKFSITDASGAALKLEDLKEDDVVSVYSDVYPGATKVVDSKSVAKDYIEDADSLRFIVSTKTVEGTVTSKSSKKVYIDGEAYETDGVLLTSDVALEDEGTFYLDFNGDIAFTDTSAVLDNFEFVYDGEKLGRDITLYTMNSKGEKVSYKMGTTVKVNTTKEEVNAKGDTVIVPVSYSFSMSDTTDRDNLAKELKITSSGDGLTEQYVVSLKTNANNEITRVDVLRADEEESVYNKYDTMMGNYVLDSDTVIFTLPANEAFDEENLKVSSASSLSNKRTYKYKVFDMNKKDIVTAMVVYTTDSSVEADSEIAVIQSVTTTKDGDDTVLSLTMIQGGKIVTRNTKEDDQFFINSTMEAMYGNSAKIAYGAYPGQIIMYSTNSTGAIANTFRLFPRPCAKADYVEGYYMNDLFQTWNNNAKVFNKSAQIYIVAGRVVSLNDNDTISIQTGHDSAVDGVKGVSDLVSTKYLNARVTVVDTNLSSEEQAVRIGKTSDIKKGDFVVIRKNQGNIKDIVVYKNFEAAPAYYK